jgi:lysophospholipase L1-like esterase
MHRLATSGVIALIILVSAVLLAHPIRVAVARAKPAESPPAPTSAAAPTPSAAAPRPGPIHVLGLGDSVTYGSNCDCRDYISGFGALLKRRDKVQVTVDNDGKPGATTQDLADSLSHDQPLRSEVRRADIIVITIGANDLTDSLNHWRNGDCAASCYQPSIDAMSDRLRALVDQIRALHTAGPTQILVTDYWNVFTDGEVARRAEDTGYLEWSDRVTRASNTAICRAAASAQSTCVDLYHPFKPHPGADPTNLLSDDGDHPNPAGTDLISRTVLAAVDSTDRSR